MCSYPNTEMMVKLTGHKFVRVVVLVRWKQLTGEFSIDIGECSEVKWETRRYVDTPSPTLTAFNNKICGERCDVQVRELLSLEVCIWNAILNISADTLTTYIENWRCAFFDKKNIAVKWL